MSDEHSMNDDKTESSNQKTEQSDNSEQRERNESEPSKAVSDSEKDNPEKKSENTVGSADGQDNPEGQGRTGTATGEETVSHTNTGSPNAESEDAPYEKIDDLQMEVDELRDALKESRAHIEQLESRVEDYERRNSYEHENIRKYATEDIASEMLRVKDMLEDAIEMEDLEEGTERRLGAVTKQFDKTITSGSIERIEPNPRDPYDDEYHRMMEKVQTDEYEPEQIVEVLEDGYRTHDRVIRPARVRVATGSNQ